MVCFLFVQKLNYGVNIEHLPSKHKLMWLINALSQRPDLHSQYQGDKEGEELIAVVEELTRLFFLEAYNKDTWFLHKAWLH